MSSLAKKAIQLMALGATDPSAKDTDPKSTSGQTEVEKIQNVASMTLEDFSRSSIGVKVFSEVLNRQVLFVSNNKVANDLGIKKLYFTAEELSHLLNLGVTPKDLRSIVKLKEALSARLIDSELLGDD